MGKKIKNILEILNKITGINFYKFTKESSLISFPLILQSFLTFLLSIIFTRILSEKIFGEYQFFLAVLGTLSLFSLPGMDTAIIQSVANKYATPLIKIIKIRFNWSLIGSLILFVVGIHFIFITDTGKIYLIAAFFFPFLYSFDSVFSYLIGKQKFKLYSKYLISKILFINVFLIVSLIIFKKLSIVIVTYLISCFFISLFFYFIIKMKFFNKIKKSQKDEELFKYGFHLTLISLVPLISAHADKLILVYFLGFDKLAIYCIALMFPSQIKLIVKPFIRIILPKLSLLKDTKKTYFFLRSKLIYMLLFSTTIIIFGILLIPYIIKIFFPVNYLPAIFYSQILFLAFLLTLPANIFNQFLASQKRTKSIFIMYFLRDVSKIILLLVLVPFLEIMGIIISLAVANYLFFFLSLYFSKKISKD